MSVNLWYHLRSAKTSGHRDRLVAAVAYARRMGATWSGIAGAVGMSTSGARRLVAA